MDIKHPAKYSDAFIPIFAKELPETGKILDPFAGTGKISEIKQCGFHGVIFANDIEPEWAEIGKEKCDVVTVVDAELLPNVYQKNFFDAICTSPTYGNRMADHHHAKDGSRRNTYTHSLGRALADGNTGKMQWGAEYREKHERIYKAIIPLLKCGGIFVLNVSNHIRRGKEEKVSEWHLASLVALGLELIKDIHVATPRNKFGANSDKRVEYEHIYVLKKTNKEDIYGLQQSDSRRSPHC